LAKNEGAVTKCKLFSPETLENIEKTAEKKFSEKCKHPLRRGRPEGATACAPSRSSSSLLPVVAAFRSRFW
jgi:hypothetical protein